MLRRVGAVVGMAGLCTACPHPIEGPFDPDAAVECAGGDRGFFVAVGHAGDFAVQVSDLEPLPALVDMEGDQLLLEGLLPDGSYSFSIQPASRIEEGEVIVVRDEEVTEGIALSLVVSRAATGRFELASVEGAVSFSEVETDHIAGTFEAAFGSSDDWFDGCFLLPLQEEVQW